MESLIDKIYKQIGENDYNQDVSDWLSAGLLPLNKIVSGRFHGGLPVGRITEIYGGASSGKTLMATMAMIETQRRGGLAVFLDYEHAFSLRRAIKLGLSDDKTLWIYKQPNTAEEGFGVMEFVANTIRTEYPEKFVTVVIDSVAAMQTKEELETGYGEGNMRTRLSLAACMSQSLKKIAGMVSKTNVTLLFLNQTRDNPGIMFGEKEGTTGGNALKFYASTRVKLTKGKKVKSPDDQIVGEHVTAQVVKNKVYEPFGQTEYLSHFQQGIALDESHLMFLQEKKLLGETKGWLELDGKKYRYSDLAAQMRTDAEVKAKVMGLFETLES